jgi:DNA-3-methyladenine glycosylase II
VLAVSRTTYPDQSEALARRDARFAPLLERFGPADLGPRPRMAERYEALARMVAYQQLHGAAAASIWARVRALVPAFEPATVLDVGPDRLRAAGCRRPRPAP